MPGYTRNDSSIYYQLIESQGLNSTEYRAMANRGTVLGILLAIFAASIITLMVAKPPLWS